MVKREREGIKTRLLPGYTTGHRSPASTPRLTDLHSEERAYLQVLPSNKATSIISHPAVIGNNDCMVYSHLLSPNTDTETNSAIKTSLSLSLFFFFGTTDQQHCCVTRNEMNKHKLLKRNCKRPRQATSTGYLENNNFIQFLSFRARAEL